jgi:hypothetical protein
MFPPARVIYSSLFFVLVMTLIVVTKPALLFLADGRVRPFGIGDYATDDHTPFPLGAVVVILAITSMFIFSTIDVIYAPPQQRYVPTPTPPAALLPGPTPSSPTIPFPQATTMYVTR